VTPDAFSFLLVLAAGFGLGYAYAHRHAIVDGLCEWRWLVGEGDEWELPASRRTSVRVLRDAYDYQRDGEG